MPTILDTLKKGAIWLEKRGIDEARLNMEHLIAHLLACDRMQLYIDFDRPLTDAELDELRELTKRRAGGEPLQHILGTVEFCGLEFFCDNRALIPRPETEELAAQVAQFTILGKPDILDVGCGSGVLGLSLLHLLADREPSLVLGDISRDALDLASENVDKLQLGPKNIQLIETDLFSNVSDTFDLIVANLPYVSNEQRSHLSPEVQWDPDTALYGGEEGTELIQRFLEEAPSRLNPGAVLAIEFGIGQGDTLKTFADSRGLGNLETLRDLSGVERFLFATQAA